MQIFSSPFGGGLFGAISWPLSRFQLAPGVVLEQQIFLPHDGSAAAFSWQLHAQSPLRARLTIKPFFSGCGPRSYRDVGFCLDSEENGGRLTWLPNVRGPRIIAIQMANITMNRRDSLSPLAIKKQHPLHPKISSRPELSNLS
ncbi:MAG: hypothetical protein DMF22_12380 [Verrucomicrobia bacterium]|nr:MAG: hypothetical protein DMF22_12380 [Verrucomicrobiota bacterium]